MLDVDPDLPFGAQPVAHAGDLAPDERRLLRLFRRWLSGYEAQRAAWADLCEHHGDAGARAALAAFEAWLSAVADGATRRLQRHHLPCPCVGRDEALLTGLVSAAGRGDAETARALALEIVRPDAASFVGSVGLTRVSIGEPMRISAAGRCGAPRAHMSAVEASAGTPGWQTPMTAGRSPSAARKAQKSSM